MTAVSPEIASAIDARQEIMREGFATGDAEKIVTQFYAPDAWVLGGGDQTWKGAEGMRTLYGPLVGKYFWSIEREALVAMGDGAVLELLVGTITPTDPAEETLVYKIQFTWAKRGDDWLCVTQFFDFGTHFKEAA